MKPAPEKRLRDYRRGIERVRTAKQIVLFQTLAVATVCATLKWRFPDTRVRDAATTTPGSATFTGLALMIISVLGLALGVGWGRLILANAVSWGFDVREWVHQMFIDGSQDPPNVDRRLPRWVFEILTEPTRKEAVERHDLLWYGLVGAAVLGQAAVVAGTGGMASSPFAQILIATFILGQFRANSIRAIWTLFWFAMGTAVVAHSAFILLERADTDRGTYYSSVFFRGIYYAPAGVLVAFASTWVFYETVRHDARTEGYV